MILKDIRCDKSGHSQLYLNCIRQFNKEKSANGFKIKHEKELCSIGGKLV